MTLTAVQGVGGLGLRCITPDANAGGSVDQMAFAGSIRETLTRAGMFALSSGRITRASESLT